MVGGRTTRRRRPRCLRQQRLKGRPVKIEVVGAAATIGKRLENALGYSGRMESTVLLAEPETLDAELL